MATDLVPSWEQLHDQQKADMNPEGFWKSLSGCERQLGWREKSLLQFPAMAPLLCPGPAPPPSPWLFTGQTAWPNLPPPLHES
jgi:hypothetical protein